MMDDQKPKMGRPSLYKTEYAQQAEKLCALGATERELADFFGISMAGFTKWKTLHPDLVASLKIGRTSSDERVERRLYNRAVGYTYDDEKIFCFQGQIIKEPIKVHVAPDTTAQIFWLKNRRPDAWRDVHKHEVGRAGEFTEIKDEQLLALIQEEAEAIGEELIATNQGTGSVN